MSTAIDGVLKQVETDNEDTHATPDAGSCAWYTKVDKKPYVKNDAATEYDLTIDNDLISTGVLAPSSTPSRLGQIFVDTVAPNVYIATGTASSADWTIVS